VAKRKTSGGRAAAAKLDHIAGDLRPLAVPIGEFVLDPRNARKHDEQNVAAIAASLQRFGQRKPIVANRANKQIEAGNGTLLAAQTLGWSQLAVVWVEDDPAAATGFAVADNRTAELAAWDEEILADLLSETREELGDLYDELLLDEFDAAEDDDGQAAAETSQAVPDAFQVVVDCRDEADQKRLYERLQKEGRNCRLLTV